MTEFRFYIKISDEFDIDICVTFLNFQSSSQSSYLVNAITQQELPVSCPNFTGLIVHIKISDEFNIDLCLTFLNFQTRSLSNGGK